MRLRGEIACKHCTHRTHHSLSLAMLTVLPPFLCSQTQALRLCSEPCVKSAVVSPASLSFEKLYISSHLCWPRAHTHPQSLTRTETHTGSLCHPLTICSFHFLSCSAPSTKSNLTLQLCSEPCVKSTAVVSPASLFFEKLYISPIHATLSFMLAPGTTEDSTSPVVILVRSIGGSVVCC